MQKASITKKIHDTGAMAIVRVNTIERGIEIAQGCLNGGIDCLEISYTLPNASDVIRALKEQFGEQLTIGAGTILDEQTARLAILAGAQFIIAPNFQKRVAVMCNRYQIPYAPGCTSLSEAIEAMEWGAAFIKAFPISDFYGSKLAVIFKTPIPYMPILASGGINLHNVADYVESGVDCCGFGGLLTNGTISQISENAKAIRLQITQSRALLERKVQKH